jgi:hypothetical protein
MNLEPGTHELEVPTQPAPFTSREWVAIRDECRSGGELNDLCNLVATIHGAELEVVSKTLSCGCILVPEDLVESDEDVII